MIGEMVHSWTMEKLTRTQPNRVLDQPTFYFCVQCRHTLVVKGDLATYEDVEDDAKAPDVDFWPRIHPCVEQLWRSKVERAAKSGELGYGVIEIGEAEIYYFDVAGLGYKDVFDFEIWEQHVRGRATKKRKTDRGGRRCSDGNSRGRFRSALQTCGLRARAVGRG